MMRRVPAPMEGMIDLMVDDKLEPYIRLQSKVYCMLGKFEPNIHSQMLLNLGRGWCSSLSGRAFKVYCLLAGHFDFPVFALGRGSRMIVSCRHGSPPSVTEFIEPYEALWNLGKDPTSGNWYDRYFQTVVRRGPAAGWVMVEMNRPAKVNAQGLLNTGGWSCIWDAVPKSKILEAISAVRREEILEIEINQ